MKKYPKYKDSGIPWIGEIPEEWEVRRLKTLGEIKGGLTYSPEDECSAEEGTIVLRSSNIFEDKLVFEDNVYVKKKLSEKDYVQIGDLLICSRNGSASLVGKSALIDKPIKATFGAFMMIFRAYGNINNHYLHFLSQVCINKYKATFKTSTINQLTKSLFSNIYTPYIPTPAEQRAIASFLEKKNEQINNCICLRERELQTLNELKQAQIANVVTKGLDPNVPMKDSGIPWIGQIPAHWEEICLKRVFSDRQIGAWGDDVGKDKNNIVCLRIADFDYDKLSFKQNIEYTLRSYKDAELSKRLLHKGDILVEKSGGGDKTPVGRAVIYDLNISQALYANFLERLRCNKDYNPEFVVFTWSVFYRKMIWKYVKQTIGLQNLDLSSLLKNESFYFPSLSEQNAIVSYLKNCTQTIDTYIASLQAEIEHLKEYKQRLISDVVTGKIDVRDEA